MNLKDKINKYSELYSVKKNRVNKLLIKIIFSAVEIIALGIIMYSFIMYDANKMYGFIAIPFLFLIAYELFFGIDKLSKFEHKVKRGGVYSGPLSDVFDLECPYTKYTLKKCANLIEDNVNEKKGIQSEILLLLVQKIAGLKILEKDYEKFRLYQDMYDISHGESVKREPPENISDKIEVLGYAQSLRDSNRHKDFSKPSNFLYMAVTFFLVFFLFVGYVFFFSPETQEYFTTAHKADLNNYLLIMACTFAPLYILIFAVSKLPMLKPKKISLYDVFDMSDIETREMFKKNIVNLYQNSYRNNGYSDSYIWMYKQDIKEDKSNKAKMLTEEERNVLMEGNTNLGKLLNDVKKL